MKEPSKQGGLRTLPLELLRPAAVTAFASCSIAFFAVNSPLAALEILPNHVQGTHARWGVLVPAFLLSTILVAALFAIPRARQDRLAAEPNVYAVRSTVGAMIVIAVTVPEGSWAASIFLSLGILYTALALSAKFGIAPYSLGFTPLITSAAVCLLWFVLWVFPHGAVFAVVPVAVFSMAVAALLIYVSDVAIRDIKLDS